MKTLEQKAKAYDEALEKAKSEYQTHKSFNGFCEMLVRIFPELKESEDEGIRKELLEHCKNQAKPYIQTGNKCPQIQSWIAWLEKQVTPQVRTGIEWVNTIDDACDERYIEEYSHGEYCHEQSFKWGFQEGVEWLEKQGEQKPQGKTALEAINEEKVDNANKVEPRQEKLTKFEKAVKQVMEEAIECGDTHNLKADAEMLLSLAHSSTWSKEDEEIINGITSYLCTHDSCELDGFNKWYDFLKYLKERYTWKPSDEQMELLSEVQNALLGKDCHNRFTDFMWELKKLKEGRYESK